MQIKINTGFSYHCNAEVGRGGVGAVKDKRESRRLGWGGGGKFGIWSKGPMVSPAVLWRPWD